LLDWEKTWDTVGHDWVCVGKEVVDLVGVTTTLSVAGTVLDTRYLAMVCYESGLAFICHMYLYYHYCLIIIAAATTTHSQQAHPRAASEDCLSQASGGDDEIFQECGVGK
jgi:hypothetical protein